MKITKLVHSCVLIEDGDKAVLIDPGIFSWNSGSIDISKFPQLTNIIVTHQHGDHLGEPFVKALVQAQPEVQWIAPEDSHDKLKSMGVVNVSNQSNEYIEVKEVNHADVEPFGVQVKNLVVNIFGFITDPGDTYDFSETKDILLLPVQAPWGTVIRAIEIGLELKPKYIIPIHDWMWNDDWREHVYNRFEDIFSKTDTKFIRPVIGEEIDIDI